MYTLNVQGYMFLFILHKLILYVTMLSTANATHAHSFRTLGRLEALWLPLRSDKWVRQGVCQKQDV